ncbi:hypothetical protein TCAL_12143 [Tigriopus californicus]|uniref:TNFR-Cys domain-containing protein n=1 Tax=Tigriopus californicus TaxID=6832 RepID=A0A553PD93_TIGCA|nr:uncharacterized protein LOC131892995 [Tigriopus californicus]TRY75644.1 hypothetical protein TCAL_12143 [Tigriopus californicus]|eukprot:TCALIF_12143-PA protein Name:"Protein of unknown function" AED:0.00 eAED:0.00 QI:433/1/0.5/1/0.66/0.75/4/36/427
MPFGARFLLCFCLLGMSVARPSEPHTDLLKCKEDSGCHEGSYCQYKLNQSICISCHSCQMLYNRQNSSQNLCVKNWKDCGQCLPGFDEETLTGNKTRDRCIPSVVSHSVLSQGTTLGEFTPSPEVDQQITKSHWLTWIPSGIIMLGIICICCRWLWKNPVKRQNGTPDVECLTNLIAKSSEPQLQPSYDEAAIPRTELGSVEGPREEGNNATPFNTAIDYRPQTSTPGIGFMPDPNDIDHLEPWNNQVPLGSPRDPGSPTGSQISRATEPSVWEPTLDDFSEYDEQDNIHNSSVEVNDSGCQTDAGTMNSIEGSQNSLPSTTSRIENPHAHSSPIGSVTSDLENVVASCESLPKAVIEYSPTLVPQRSFSVTELSSNSTRDALPLTTTSDSSTTTTTGSNQFKRSISHQQDQDQPVKRRKSNDIKEN